MKQVKQWLLTVAFIVTATMAISQSIFADMIADSNLGAQTIVNRFNNRPRSCFGGLELLELRECPIREDVLFLKKSAA